MLTCALVNKQTELGPSCSLEKAHEPVLAPLSCGPRASGGKPTKFSQTVDSERSATGELQTIPATVRKLSCSHRDLIKHTPVLSSSLSSHSQGVVQPTPVLPASQAIVQPTQGTRGRLRIRSADLNFGCVI